ncbi:MAG: hypothetical protein H6745_19990 [Deltaproteobacteria bacterium]|nr:hypothetical protein [Deltaproteobacteria bacterium]
MTPPRPLSLALALALAAGLAAGCVAVPPPLGEADAADTAGDGGADDEGVDGVSDAVAPGSAIAGLSCGRQHCCARDERGAVSCWGDQRHAQLGAGVHGVAAPARAVTGLASVASGAFHACGLDADGRLVCWGYNEHYQSHFPINAAVEAPRLYDDDGGPVPADAPVTRVFGGAGFSMCGATGAAGLACWGAVLDGQVVDFDGMVGNIARSEPVAVAALDGVAIVDACTGQAHACAVTSGGAVLCWGRDDQGQLGLGDLGVRAAPTVLGALAGVDARAVACGLRFTCVAGVDRGTAAPALRCFGENADGQSGATPSAAEATPVVLDDALGGREVRALALGDAHACALLGPGEGEGAASLWCWGAEDAGQLGPGAPGARFRPGRVPLDFTPTAVAAGQRATCAAAGAEVWCWGSDVWGQLGTGTYGLSRNPTPRRIALPE